MIVGNPLGWFRVKIARGTVGEWVGIALCQLYWLWVQITASPSVVPRQATKAPVPGNLSEMQILEPWLSPTESGIWDVGANNVFEQALQVIMMWAKL